MSDRITIKPFKEEGELPVRLPNIGGLEKVNTFIKNEQDAESSINKTSNDNGNFLKSEKERKVREARKEVEQAYGIKEEVVEPIPSQTKPLKAPEKEKKDVWGSFKNLWKNTGGKLFLGTSFLLLGSTALKAENGGAEREFAKNKNNNEYVNKDPGGGERKVKEVPPGYVKSHTVGNKTYYKKTVSGGELKIAKPGNGKESKEYEDWLKNLLKSGTASPEQLAKMKYISTEAIEKYQKYYTPPSEDIVYTEPEATKESDPFGAYAEYGESIWGTNRHLIGFLSAAVRDTKSITEQGNLNTSKSEHKVLLRLVDKMGKPTGECVELTTGEVQNYFGTTMTMQSDELMAELKKRVKKSTTYTATNEDFAKNK